MNIYHVSQEVNSGFDTYSDFVVAAENEEESKRIHPSSIWADNIIYDEEKKGFWTKNVNKESYLFENPYGPWTNDLNAITVRLIGLAAENVKRGVITSSYHAG